MIEILKLVLDNKEAGIALFFAVLFYMDMRKKVISLDGHITNHVMTGLRDIKDSIEKQTELLERKLK